MNPLVAPEPAVRDGRTRLSVNLNKVALLRNTRHLGIPSVTRAGEQVLLAGAQGLTVHPRPDERHIRAGDVDDLTALLTAWPQIEFNIEGNPLHNLMDLVRRLSSRGRPPHQVTFVPDTVGQFTSDHGWFTGDGGAVEIETLRPFVVEAQSLGIRVSLFIDPLPAAMRLAREAGADRVELYTEAYARAHGTPQHAEVLGRYVDAAEAALALGLGINAGHDLNRDNLTDFLRAVPGVLEVSIGHALIADALELGYAETVRAYQACIQNAFAPAR
jgi:pyridoxine 5-phosphate synthase